MKNTTIYKIDNCHAAIEKIKGGYRVNTISSTMHESFCNESAVSNIAEFKTIKECKKHVDLISITH
jgi:hypothetical protein